MFLLILFYYLTKVTHIRCKYLDPSWFLLSSGVLKAERHALFIGIPPLHLCPVKGDYLILGQNYGVSMDVTIQ